MTRMKLYVLLLSSLYILWGNLGSAVAEDYPVVQEKDANAAWGLVNNGDSEYRKGYIKAISSSEVIIDDLHIPLASGISYFKEDGTKSGRSSFGAGKFVVYLVDDDEEITEMWLMTPGVEDQQPDSQQIVKEQQAEEDKETGSSTIRLEDGVYKN